MASWPVTERNIRRGYNDLCIDQVLIKGGIGALLVRGGDQFVPFTLKVFADAQLVLGAAEEAGLVFGVLASLEHNL